MRKELWTFEDSKPGFLMQGRYPVGYLDKVLTLFPNAKKILHCPSGSVMGPGTTVDCRREGDCQPQWIARADKLPFGENTFDLYLADVADADANQRLYHQPPFPHYAALKEARRVLKHGGHYGLLYFSYPYTLRQEWELEALIGVISTPSRYIRVLSIHRCLKFR